MPPTPPQRTSAHISPELVLVDRELLPTVRGDGAAERPVSHQTAAEVDSDVREAMRRVCEFSDVNPPVFRRRRLLAFVRPATLWVEAALLVAHVPLGAL